MHRSFRSIHGKKKRRCKKRRVEKRMENTKGAFQLITHSLMHQMQNTKGCYNNNNNTDYYMHLQGCMQIISTHGYIKKCTKQAHIHVQYIHTKCNIFMYYEYAVATKTKTETKQQHAICTSLQSNNMNTLSAASTNHSTHLPLSPFYYSLNHLHQSRLQFAHARTHVDTCASIFQRFKVSLSSFEISQKECLSRISTAAECKKMICSEKTDIT